MTLSSRFTHIWQFLKTRPRYYWVVAGVVLVAVSYSLAFFIPKSVQFSYAGETCVSQLLIAPGVQSSQSSEFIIKPSGELKIGSWAIASTKVCIEPMKTPTAGTHAARIAPFGGMVAAKQFTITAQEPPVANLTALGTTAISTIRPLRIELSTSDTIHDYSITNATQTAPCTEDDAKLSCDVAALHLKQGEKYTLSLVRAFKGGGKQTLHSNEVETLSPLQLKEASIQNGQVVYIKPKEFIFTADRPVASAKATLTQQEGEVNKNIPVTIEADGAVLKVLLTGDLARKSTFHLTLNEVIGVDGSSLAEPRGTTFSTSGGPKVANVSIGANRVDRNAQIIVTFDQPLAESVDIATFARVEGVNGAVQKRSNEQIAFTLAAAPDCAAFKLVIDKGVKSGVNDETSEAWSHVSRTLCGTSWVIGNSVRGRPIIAYSFGGGPQTILFTGGIHGSERSGQQTMQAFVDYLQTNGDRIPANRRVVVVPNTNPDGIATGSRNNVNNVNIDRNFPASNWQADIDTASGTIKNGGGTSPGSEPETQALIALTRQLRPWLSVSYHAQGRLVGANQVGISVQAGNVYSSTVGYGTMYGAAEDVMGYSITGEYEDWMGEALGVAAILIELPTPNGNYISSQLPAIMKLLSL